MMLVFFDLCMTEITTVVGLYRHFII